MPRLRSIKTVDNKNINIKLAEFSRRGKLECDSRKQRKKVLLKS